MLRVKLKPGISASADPPHPRPRADLNPNEGTRVKGIGVRTGCVLFLSTNFKGSVDEGRSIRFAEPDGRIPPENLGFATACPASSSCRAGASAANRLPGGGQGNPHY